MLLAIPVLIEAASCRRECHLGLELTRQGQRLLALGVGGGMPGSLDVVGVRVEPARGVQQEGAETSSLGIVPAARELAGKTALLTGSSAAAEAIRQIRTNLRFVSIDSPAKSIVITSSNEGEGKSTLAANIAAMFADAEEPTILIDADLRRPMQAERLGLDGAVGLSQLLAGTAKLSDALLQTDHRRLSALPAGRIPPNPADMVGSSRMKRLIEHLSKSHMVIIDAPPLLPVTDAALLAAASDGAVVVVHSGKTRREQLEVAAHKVRQVEANLLGIVLNRVAKKDLGEATFGYGYGSYTSKYYREDSDPKAASIKDRARRVTKMPAGADEFDGATTEPRRPVA